MPADKKTDKTCKTLLSAVALGYSTPVIVNWGNRYDDPNLSFGGAQNAKIRGVLDYLNGLPPDADNDLVVLVDGLDVWFQLRPETLLCRYFEILKRQDRRNRAQYGSTAVARQNMQQNVIFTAQKRCWPLQADNPACHHLPDSTLPIDVYGTATDLFSPDRRVGDRNFRPRYLNSGAAIGTAAALRAVFVRAQEKLMIDSREGLDQYMFAEIFGEQENMRHLAAGKYVQRAGWWTWMRGTPDQPDTLDDGLLAFEPEADKNYEFGIGLDYEQALVMSTAFSEYDTDWVRFAESKKPVTLPADITRTALPSSMLDKNTIDGDPSLSSWDHVRLFTDTRTGSIPAAIHHNAFKFSLKSRLKTHWNFTWYQPHLRTVLDARALSPDGPVASLDIDGDGVMHEWWSDNSLRVGAVTALGEELSFKKLCGGFEKELFRDDKGPWHAPTHDDPQTNG